MGDTYALVRATTVKDRFGPGTWVDLREIWDGRTWELRRGIVVRDDPDVTAVYTPPATPALIAADADGTRLRLPPPEWSLAAAATPPDRHFVAVHPPGAEHSVLAIWDAGWRLLHWYINLESDLIRTGQGFEYEDHILDAIVEPDMSSWAWKDEDELEEALTRGLFSSEQAAKLYTEGERAIEWLLARHPPYDAAWEDWRPADDWAEQISG